MVLDILLEGREDLTYQIHALEHYVALREYLLLDIIMNRLEGEMTEKARDVIGSLMQHLRNEFIYHASQGGLKEAVILETALVSWHKQTRERHDGKVGESLS
ncbi:MAG: hypothetical protein GSR75_00370 [Desulfurococcales archaeon]|nr:hypothetical protein [Desulfurococcales archaeon]